MIFTDVFGRPVKTGMFVAYGTSTCGLQFYQIGKVRENSVTGHHLELHRSYEDGFNRWERGVPLKSGMDMLIIDVNDLPIYKNKPE